MIKSNYIFTIRIGTTFISIKEICKEIKMMNKFFQDNDKFGINIFKYYYIVVNNNEI